MKKLEKSIRREMKYYGPRIRAGELLDYTFVKDYPRIGECLLLSFSKPPYLRPVRPYRYGEYVDILADWNRSQRRQRGDTA